MDESQPQSSYAEFDHVVWEMKEELRSPKTHVSWAVYVNTGEDCEMFYCTLLLNRRYFGVSFWYNNCNQNE